MFSLLAMCVISASDRPLVNSKKIDVVFRSKDTLWYDETSMPQAYQDDVPPVLGIRSTLNTSLPPANVISGGEFFFPFSRTAGTHRCHNVKSTKFLWRPQKKPIVVWRDGIQFKWIFPHGAIVGEILYLKGPGDWYAFEVRARERHKGRWVTSVFRPFPTAEHLARRLPPSEQQLRAFCYDVSTVKPAAIRETFAGASFEAVGGMDVLPPIEDRLAARLLRRTPFIACDGERWKINGDVECHAPTASDEFSIVPQNYDAGVYETSQESCIQCHRSTARPVAHFHPNEVLYGRIWGSDQVFSFHPFDPAYIGDEDIVPPNNAIRSDFLRDGVVEWLEPSKHTSDWYDVLE